MYRMLVAVTLFVFTCFPSYAFDPKNLAWSGYVNVFDDEFTSLSTIDLSNTKAPGFKWYVQYPFGSVATPSANFSIGANGLTLTESSTAGLYPQWMLSTIAVKSGGQGFVGQAFGGQGGWYAEVSLSFDNTLVNPANGWPTFWAESLQHSIFNAGLGASQWPGQAANYEHFVEDDVFEYDTVASDGYNSYGINFIDWYGIAGVTCSGFCSISPNYPLFVAKLPGTITWTNQHVIGQRYVPGRANNGWIGFLENYFDGKLVNVRYSWTNPIGSFPAPPPSGTNIFSIMDRNSVVFVLGTGTSAPMTVRYVRIWVPYVPFEHKRVHHF